MARGWESKSVEEQKEAAESEHGGAARATGKAAPEKKDERTLARERKLAALNLSRRRVQQSLANCENPRYKQMLEQALADLERELASLAHAGKS